MVIKVAVPHQFKLKVIPDFRTLLFPDRRDIHYIGGSEILPSPLDTEAEQRQFVTWDRKRRICKKKAD